MKKSIIKLIATGLGLGYSPIAPGTAGSLLGIIIFFILLPLNLHPAISACIITILFFIGVFVSTEAEKIFNKKDARQIVIDEVVGCLIFLYLVPPKIWYIILGFIIYRILDIIKPFPAGWSQKLHAGWGIMIDDLIVGIYTGIIINIALLVKNSFCH